MNFNKRMNSLNNIWFAVILMVYMLKREDVTKTSLPGFQVPHRQTLVIKFKAAARWLKPGSVSVESSKRKPTPW